MGSMLSALEELRKDNIAAGESNARLGLKRGMRVTVTGGVSWSPDRYDVTGKPATIQDLGWPTTALVRFDDGTEGYTAKENLTPLKKGTTP